MKTIRQFSLALAAGLACAAGNAADAGKGKTAFIDHACWQCHGTVGQGGAGPKLAPDPKPLEFLSIFIRHSAGTMPPYSTTILSDEDLADIHAYLKSVPKAADYKSIPLLNN